MEDDLAPILSLQASQDPAVRALANELLTNVRERTQKLKAKASATKAVALPDQGRDVRCNLLSSQNFLEASA